MKNYNTSIHNNKENINSCNQIINKNEIIFGNTKDIKYHILQLQ